MSLLQSISAGFGALATLVVVGLLLAGSILSKPLPIASIQADEASSDEVAPNAAALQRPRPVKLFTVAPQGRAEQRYFFGRVATRQTIYMAFKVGGELVEFPALEGQAVRRGDLLAKLDTGAGTRCGAVALFLPRLHPTRGCAPSACAVVCGRISPASSHLRGRRLAGHW